MTPQQFIAKWKPVALTERAAAQSHFLDLCALLSHDDPVSADPAGKWFTFEKGVAKTGGGDGFADVWKKGFFAWEYKKRSAILMTRWRNWSATPPRLRIRHSRWRAIRTACSFAPPGPTRFPEPTS